MAKAIPTQRGDVLILRTAQTFTTHAVGQVSRDGQQDFQGEENVKHEKTYAAAVAVANAMVAPGRRIFFRDFDTGEWSALSE